MIRKRETKKGLVLKYAAFLSAFVLLTAGILGHGLYSTDTLKGDATAVNLAGSLRMRSFKMAYLMHKSLGADEAMKLETLTRLEEEVEEFERILLGLRDGNQSLGLKGVERKSHNQGLWHRLTVHLESYRKDIKPIVSGFIIAPSQVEAVEALSRYERDIANFVGDIDGTVKALEELSEEKLGNFRLIQFSLLGVSIAVAGGLSVLVIFFLQRPLQEVVKGMVDIARGDWTKRIAVKTRDEIGELARGFNFMAKELERLEEAKLQLYHAQKMSTLGQLSSSIVHGIRTPLTSIVLNADLLLEELERGLKNTKAYEGMKTSLKNIEEAARHCEEVVRDLLKFSRMPQPKKTSLNINELLEYVLSLLSPHIRRQQIRLKEEFVTGLPQVIGSRGQLETLFMNLVANAVEAMPHGGTLTIRDRLIYEEGVVEIQVSDTGKGIKKEDIPKLFKPFFTTKPEGQGTGLGLSTSANIIKAHNGMIRLDSEEGSGTTVTIRLPVALEKQTG